MKDGTILLWDKRKTNKGFRLFISKMIAKLTHAEVTHSGILLRNNLLEQDMLSRGREGLIITRATDAGTVNKRVLAADYVLEPKIPLTEDQTLDMFYYITGTYSGYGYNVMKLLLMAFLGLLKPMFRKRKWMPFDKPWFGEVCSVMPDEAYKEVGIDLFPGEFEGYTAPGDYLKSDKLKKTKGK